MTTRIQLERSGSIATIWLDRADKRNAMDGALVRDLVAAHGGSVSAASDGIPGRGSAFTVRLPLRD